MHLKELQQHILTLTRLNETATPVVSCYINVEAAPSGACPSCGDSRIREVKIKEEMIRRAERSRSEVEIVNHSEDLTRLGGVGCLLRFLWAEKPCAKAA